MKAKDQVELEEITGRIPYVLRALEAIDVASLVAKARESYPLKPTLQERTPTGQSDNTSHIPQEATPTDASADDDMSSEERQPTTSQSDTLQPPESFTLTEEGYDMLVTSIHRAFWEAPIVGKLILRLSDFIAAQMESLSDRQREA